MSGPKFCYHMKVRQVRWWDFLQCSLSLSVHMCLFEFPFHPITMSQQVSQFLRRIRLLHTFPAQSNWPWIFPQLIRSWNKPAISLINSLARKIPLLAYEKANSLPASDTDSDGYSTPKGRKTNWLLWVGGGKKPSDNGHQTAMQEELRSLGIKAWP